MILLLYLLIAIMCIACAIALYLILLSFYTLIGNKHVPYVPLPDHALDAVIDALQLSDSSVVYDLGCGDGKILRGCYHRFPHAHYIGIEKGLFPYLLSRIKNKNIPADTVHIMRKSFFDHSVSDATHIVLYLFPFIMDKLLPKLEQECTPGTRIVSIDFQFNAKKPTHIIELNSSHHLGKKLFVYKF